MKKGRRNQDWLRTVGIGVFLIVAVLSFLYANIDWFSDWDPIPEAALDAGSTVYFIDCGQGDSTLIVSDGAVALIDASTREAGPDVVTYLQGHGVKKIDYLILTHPHEDHIGGAASVLQAFSVDKIYMSKPTQGTEPTTANFLRLMETIEGTGNGIHAPEPGEQFTLGSFTFTVLGPLEEYKSLNNQSLVVRAEYGKISFIFTGDQEKDAEEALVERYGRGLSATVLKAGHHGGRSSTCDAFLQAVQPQYGVISCGKDNTYGHPHAETLRAFEDYGITTLRTDLSGTIRMVTDGEGLTVEKAA